MTTAIRSVFTGGVALAGAAVMAVSPLAPTVDIEVPRLESAAVALTGLATPPPLGAIPYQALINGVADVVALAPILFGSTAQCTACLGPAAPPSTVPIPFSGWGLVGIGTGLLTSPVALVQTLIDSGDIGKALGAAVAAIQTPITNTLSLLSVPRLGFGGFELQGVLDRAFATTKDTVNAILNIAAQALVTGPVAVVKGVTAGVQTFALTLAATGNVVDAFNAGVAPIKLAVTESVDDLVAEVGKNRTIIYNDLKTGPGKTTSPIPTVVPPVAAVRGAAALTAAPAASARRASTVKAPTAAAAAKAGPAKVAAGAARRAAR